MDDWKTTKENLRKTYFGSLSVKERLKSFLCGGDSWFIYQFLLHLRRYELLIKRRTTPWMTFCRIWHLRQYQRYARICGYVIGDGVLGDDVIFFHRASIIINPDARVGSGCLFHGDCCLGVSRTGDRGCPVLGKNVDIGTGAKILGNITIADNIVIGANAVVTHSFTEPGITIAGIPARKIETGHSTEEIS